MDPVAQKRCYTQSIQPCRDVVENDTPTLGKALKTPNGDRLGDVEKTEEDEGDKSVTPVRGAEEEGDPLAGHLIDYDKAGIVTSALSGGDGGSRDPQTN